MSTLALSLLFLVPRFAVVVGSNRAAGQLELHYAERDAERVAQVFEELGAFRPSDVVLLREPSVGAVKSALARADEAAGRSSGALILFYYSGHADSQALLLGDERLSYSELRERIERSPASIRIALIDACQSGAAARSKGGTRADGYAVGVVDPERVRGAAIITASTASEQAQESSEIGGSYFTHHLISALRGAGDLDHDGRVTLAEAYRYTYGHTIAATASSLEGPQHPSYEFRLAGTGEVTLSQLTGAATLVLPRAADGAYLILDRRRELVAEARPDPTHAVRIAIAPGSYRVVVRRLGKAEVADVEIRAGTDLALETQRFKEAPLEIALAKGTPALSNLLTVEYALFGLSLADLGAASQVAIGYRRLLGRVALATRLGYAHAQIDNLGFTYQLDRLDLDGELLYPMRLGPLELAIGGGPGLVYLRQSPSGTTAQNGWGAAARAAVSLATTLRRRFVLRMAWDAGALLLRVNQQLVVRPELKAALAVGVAF
jgi:hypothetical protein